VKRLLWQRAALSDIAEIKAYIARDNLDAANRVAMRIVGATKNLKRFPKIGRPGEIAGTRQLIVRPWKYIVVY
jgi:addiction module RelE/StbE family toxin